MADDLALITATEMEQQAVFEMLSPAEVRQICGRRWTTAVLNGRRVRLVETGIGAVNTAHALTRLLEFCRPALVIQFGIGGAYPGSGLNVGDLAVATEEHYGDLGVVTPEGWRGMDFIGFPVLEKDSPYYNRFPLDPRWIKKAHARLALATWDEGVPEIRCGPFVTVQQCSGVGEVGRELEARFEAICENMEGAAAAHVCAMYDTPLVEIRCISNVVEDRNLQTWNIPLAIQRAQMAAMAAAETVP